MSLDEAGDVHRARRAHQRAAEVDLERDAALAGEPRDAVSDDIAERLALVRRRLTLAERAARRRLVEVVEIDRPFVRDGALQPDLMPLRHRFDQPIDRIACIHRTS
jgi:hypothetical protein